MHFSKFCSLHMFAKFCDIKKRNHLTKCLFTETIIINENNCAWIHVNLHPLSVIYCCSVKDKISAHHFYDVILKIIIIINLSKNVFPILRKCHILHTGYYTWIHYHGISQRYIYEPVYMLKYKLLTLSKFEHQVGF